MTIQDLQQLLAHLPPDMDVQLVRHDYTGGDYETFYGPPLCLTAGADTLLLLPPHLRDLVVWEFAPRHLTELYPAPGTP